MAMKAISAFEQYDRSVLAGQALVKRFSPAATTISGPHRQRSTSTPLPPHPHRAAFAPPSDSLIRGRCVARRRAAGYSPPACPPARSQNLTPKCAGSATPTPTGWSNSARVKTSSAAHSCTIGKEDAPSRQSLNRDCCAQAISYLGTVPQRFGEAGRGKRPVACRALGCGVRYRAGELYRRRKAIWRPSIDPGSRSSPASHRTATIGPAETP